MKKTLTLKPSYATTNTVRFDEVVEGNAAPAVDGLFAKATPAEGALGAPVSEYLSGEQLTALGWKPSKVGEVYVAEGTRGKTYNRRDVEGPSIKLTYEVI